MTNPALSQHGGGVHGRGGRPMLWSWVFRQVGPHLRKPISAQTSRECWPLTLPTSLQEAQEGRDHPARGEDVRNLGLSTGSDRHLGKGPVAHAPVFTLLSCSFAQKTTS